MQSNQLKLYKRKKNETEKPPTILKEKTRINLTAFATRRSAMKCNAPIGPRLTWIELHGVLVCGSGLFGGGNYQNVCFIQYLLLERYRQRSDSLPAERWCVANQPAGKEINRWRDFDGEKGEYWWEEGTGDSETVMKFYFHNKIVWKETFSSILN